jgi:membrane fusion protein, heavy metal efflux system
MKPMQISISYKLPFAFLVASLFLTVLYGCGGHSHDDGHDHQHDTGHSHDDHGDQAQSHSSDDHGHGHGAAIAVTQYTDGSELFMEYEPLVQDQPTELIIHLTRLPDFSPITSGSLKIRLISANGEVYEETATAPARDGIFLPEIRPTFAGTVRMELHLNSPQLQDVQVLEDVEVFRNAEQVPHEEESTEDPNAISFLKEQQWKIDYATEPVEARLIFQATSAVATLKLPANGEAIVPAPANGIIRFHEGDIALEVGETLRSGQPLFLIDPDASWQAGLAKLSEEYQLAKAELDLVHSLQKQNAVSRKRVLEAEIKFKTLRFAFEQMGGGATPDDSEPLRAVATAPFNGIVSEIYVKPGQRVEAGDPLALIFNPDQLLLEAQVVPARLAAAETVVDASFRPAGSARSFTVSELGGRLLSQVPLAVPGSNLVILRFLFNNPDRRFIVGSKASAHILSGEPKAGGVAVPKSAIHEEEGIPIVYVQTEGETVEKRYPRLGNSDGTYVQALSGIAAGERVVTKGATFIRLSTLSTGEMGHGHAH